MGAKGVLRTLQDGGLGFWCPGCKQMHAISSGWVFDGNHDKPTFSPSVLVTGGHYCSGVSPGACWCTYNAEHPDEPAPFVCFRCHSFVRAGRIEFLGDCTHALAGQTVDLAPAPASPTPPE